ARVRWSTSPRPIPIRISGHSAHARWTTSGSIRPAWTSSGTAPTTMKKTPQPRRPRWIRTRYLPTARRPATIMPDRLALPDDPRSTVRRRPVRPRRRPRRQRAVVEPGPDRVRARPRAVVDGRGPPRGDGRELARVGDHDARSPAPRTPQR